MNDRTHQPSAARRAVLDHLLALIAHSPWAESLVLRGSSVMPAWVGAAAREPADLDWILLPSTLVPVDPRDPHPYLSDLAPVQHWPEAADGAGAYEMWRFEDFDTRGLRAHLPPEGLHWVPAAEPEPDGPHQVLRALVERHPQAAPGIRLDPDSVQETGGWSYWPPSTDEERDGADHEEPGVRVALRWTAEGTGGGQVTVDFARDERMPQPPVRTAVPRATGPGATTVLTASRELSLAWKLLWLRADGERARAKDLYDAVLLAELCAHTLEPALLRRVLAREPGHPGTLRPADLTAPPADWAALRAAHPAATGTADAWLARLRTALAPLADLCRTSDGPLTDL
ncbi:nucleotidyl transferase AbiEii/AbiGii toxin family protein [Kitasatospora phosalacinea]|uniref:nucleotidyl transferase AbiEii/AbiGii toxin family protein n=1 Tax=Kitasatospora phosalacinea TaxID=2065 RepID=UPI0035DF2A01